MATDPDAVPDLGTARIVQVAVAVLPVIGILWALNVPRRLGLVIIDEQYLALLLGLAVLVGFIVKPLPRPWTVPDLAFGAASFAGWLWLAWNYEAWLLDALNRGPEKWIPAALAIAGTIEATRRHCGRVLAILSALFMAYGFFGYLAPGIFEAASMAWARFLLYVYTDANGMPGLVMRVAATQLLGFIVFGAVLNAVGGSQALTNLAMAAMGHRRGGPAKVAIIASSLFGTLSGSTVANVLSTGVVTIPMMKKTGFPPRYAAAIEAVASNGGQIAPPVMGATAFVIAEFLQVPYSDVVLAAALPAFFYYFLLYRQVDSYAAAKGLEGTPREDLPRLGPALVQSWPLLAPLGVLMWFMFGLGYAPGTSALYASAAAYALYLVSAPRHAPRLMVIPRILVNSGQTLIPILLVCGVAGIIIGTLNITGLGFALTLALQHVAEAGGVVALLVATAGLAILLGTGMPTTGVYVVVGVLLAPALIRVGIEPMSAHLFIFYFGLLSMLTPPVAVASYTAATLAGSDMWQTGITGMKLAIVAYLLPFVFAFNPALVWHGTWAEIAVSCLTVAVAGHILAEVLASRRAYGGGAGRMIALGLALVLGGSTAIVHPTSAPALALAALAIPAAFLLSRLTGKPIAAPAAKEQT